MTWNCGNCGAEIEEGTKFCPNCGTKINWETTETEQIFTCGNCGGEFTGKVVFCPHCGTKINWDTESSFMTKISDYFRNKKYTSWIFLILFGIIYYNIRTCNSSSSSYSKYNSVEKTGGSNSITKEGKEKAERQSRKQEEAERQAREQAEKENKKKDVLEQARKSGYEKGFSVGPSSYITDDPKTYAKLHYTTYYGAPTNSEEKELYNAFVSIFVEAYEEGHKAQQE